MSYQFLLYDHNDGIVTLWTTGDWKALPQSADPPSLVHPVRFVLDGQRVLGQLRPTGIRPGFSEQLTSRGLDLPLNWFGYDGDGVFEPERN